MKFQGEEPYSCAFVLFSFASIISANEHLLLRLGAFCLAFAVLVVALASC
jgi:hypothetical protein